MEYIKQTKHNKNRLADTENKLVVATVEGGRRQMTEVKEIKRCGLTVNKNK